MAWSSEARFLGSMSLTAFTVVVVVVVIVMMGILSLSLSADPCGVSKEHNMCTVDCLERRSLFNCLLSVCLDSKFIVAVFNLLRVVFALCLFFSLVCSFVCLLVCVFVFVRLFVCLPVSCLFVCLLPRLLVCLFVVLVERA